MKTNTRLPLVPAKAAAILTSLLGIAAAAQMKNTGALYIADGGNMHVFSGNVYFDSPATTATSRTGSPGILSLGAAATWSGASSNHYIDGYVRLTGSGSLIFPVGQSGNYAPVKAVPASSATADAAYNAQSPTTIGSTVAAGLASLSPLEYWEVSGGSSQLTLSLSWGTASDVTSLTGGNLSNLTMAGWNGTQWEAIPATVDGTSFLGGASSLSAGSITTDSAVDMSVYSAFTLASKNACAPLVASSGVTSTWNGSWSPAPPTLADPVVINAPFSGNIQCNSLVLNADLSLADGQSAEIVNGVTGTGKIIMSSQASVVQRNSASGAPNIQLTKLTRPMRRFDYIFLSNPINSASAFYNQMLSKNNTAVNGSYGTYPASAFSGFKSLDASGNAQITMTSLPVGKGFRALVRNQAPYSTSTAAGAWDTDRKTIYMKAVGAANNGDVAVTIPQASWAFIGNPYPSAIDGSMMLDQAGSDVQKTLWYWTYETPMSSAFTYNSNDFATWTEAGGVTSCGTCPVPDGTIASMQSVYVKGAGTAAAPITFDITNCMRLTSGNDHFYRLAPGQRDRYWLNLEGSSGSFSQALVAYLPEATYGYDNGLDGARLITGQTSRVSSMIDGTEYAIQARPAFDAADAVPLVVNRANAESFTLSLAASEGIFNGGQKIYLHDKALGQYHDLAQGGYTFSLVNDSDADRFEVVYQNPQLGNPQFADAKALASIKNDTFSAIASTGMQHIEVFDMLGRQVASYEAKGEATFSGPFVHAEGVYVAKIQLDNGLTATQKLINRK